MENGKKLKELVVVLSGYPFRSKIDDEPSAEACVVQMRDIGNDHKINWDTLVRAHPKGRKKPDWLDNGDVLFLSKGNNNPAILVEGIPSPCVCSPQFYLLKKKVDDIDSEYLAWIMNQEPSQDYFRSNREGSGTLSVRRSVLENLEIPVPPLSVQRDMVQLQYMVKREEELQAKLLENRMQMIESCVFKLYK